REFLWPRRNFAPSLRFIPMRDGEIGPPRFREAPCAAGFTHRETRMLSRSLAALVVVLVVGGIVLAGSYTGQITAVSDKEVTILVKKDKKDKEGTKMTFKVNDKTEFFQGGKKGDEPKKISVGDVSKKLEDKEAKVFGKVDTDGEG